MLGNVVILVTMLTMVEGVSGGCDHESTLQHCSCVNVTHTSLSCPEQTSPMFVYQSVVSEATELLTLSCQPGVSRSVLYNIEASGVAGQTVSVKMVGCSSDTEEMIGLCTPVKTASLFSWSWVRNFFSFSYTYTKGQALKELDLVGCDDMERPEDFSRLIEMTSADAVALFSLQPSDNTKTFKGRFLNYVTLNINIFFISSYCYIIQEQLLRNIFITEGFIKLADDPTILQTGTKSKV